MPKLNDTLIRNAKPKEKAFKLFDGDGLYLEVATSGGKWWRLKYRFNDKEKRLSLGVYPETTLKEAREHCHEARKLLNNGIDPSENRKVCLACLTIHTLSLLNLGVIGFVSRPFHIFAVRHHVKICQNLPDFGVHREKLRFFFSRPPSCMSLYTPVA